MIFRSRSDLRFGPRALANFQVPATPSLVHGNEIFAWQQKIHDRIKQTLLLPPLFVPVGEIKGALAPYDPRYLPEPVILDRFHLSMPTDTPTIALECTEKRSHVN